NGRALCRRRVFRVPRFGARAGRGCAGEHRNERDRTHRRPEPGRHRAEVTRASGHGRCHVLPPPSVQPKLVPRSMLSDPNKEDTARRAEQWLVAFDLVRRHCGEELDQSLTDLGRIQRVLDLGVLAPTDTYELQCLGIALGRVLAHNVPGLDWAIVDDEYGRDPTIRFRKTTFQINVLTQISKRIERGEHVDVRRLYDLNVENVGRW